MFPHKRNSRRRVIKYLLSHMTPNTRGKLLIKAFSRLISSKDNLLDIGCGSGRIASDLIKHTKARLTGCDILDYTTHDLNFKLMKKPHKLPFPDKTFNISLLNDVLHHIDYETQEKLIREALRVSHKVLIFETRPTKLGSICDYILSKCYIPPLKALFTFRSDKDWKKLFSKIDIPYNVILIRKPLFYPFEHVAFQLKHKKR